MTVLDTSRVLLGYEVIQFQVPSTEESIQE
jgi:hypothetical protein